MLAILAAALAPLMALAESLSVQQELKIARNAGIEIIYSTDLVPAELMAPTPRAEATPLQRVTEALAPNGLVLRAIGVGKFVVVKADKPPPPAGTTPPPPEVLDEITVYASRYSIDARGRIDQKLLTQTDIQSIPGSHDDPMRSLRSLPGFATAASARPYVRGSLADDVLVRYDGVTLFDPFHLKNFQSLYGAIDPLAVGGMEVYSGGYPVRYGTRSGGVIDITPRPSLPGHEFDLELSRSSYGVATSGISESLPIEWLATIRSNTSSLLLEPIESVPGDPRVTDATGRVRWTVNDAAGLTLGWLLLDDTVGFDSNTDEQAAHARYRDQYVWLAYDQRIDTSLRSRTTLALAAATRKRNGSVDLPDISIGSVAEDRSYSKTELSSDWVYEPGALTALTWGAALADTEADYSYTRVLSLDPAVASAFNRAATSNLSGSGSPRARTFSAYGSLRHLWPHFESELGLRMDGQDYIDEATHLQWSPRLNLRYDFTPHWHAYGSIGRFTQAQAIEEWRTEELQHTADPAEVARHTVLGLSHDDDAGLRWSLEFYRKRWTTVSPYYESELDPTALLPDLLPDRMRIAPNASEAHGVELNVRAQLTRGLQSWISVTSAQVEDEFDTTDQRRSWDQPLAVNGGASWTGNNMNFSAVLGWHSGWPSTPVSGTDPQDSSPIVLGPRNSTRWNDYVSFDVRGSWMRPTFGGEMTLFAEITNVTDRRNLCCTVLQPPQAGSSSLGIERKAWLPLVFNVGVTMRWHSAPWKMGD